MSLRKPEDHPVLAKLNDELLPWMICARKVKRQWFVRLSGFYGYAGDLAAAAAGLGVGAPLAAVFQGKLETGQNALDVLHTALPPWSFRLGVVAAVAWVAIKIIVQREDVVARALLAREYANSISGLFKQLYEALAEADPMPKLLVIQKSVDDRVQDAIKRGVWPYDPPFPPNGDIDDELSRTIDDIRGRFMSKWLQSPPAGGIERVPDLAATRRPPSDQ